MEPIWPWQDFFFFPHDADYSEDNCPKGEQETVAIFL